MAESRGQVFRGPRSARRPRLDFAGLLAAFSENQQPNPDTPDAPGGQRKRGSRPPAAPTVEQAAEVRAMQPRMALPAAAAAQPEEPLPAARAAAMCQQQERAEGSPPRPAKQQRGAAAAAVAAIVQAAEFEGTDEETDSEAGQGEEEEDEQEQAVLTAANGSSRAGAAGAVGQRQRKRRQRVLVDVHGGAGPGAAAAAAAGRVLQVEPEQVENAYERQRLERIRRNEQMLRQLGVQEAAGGLAAAVATEQLQAGNGGAAGGACRGPPRPRERRPALPTAAVPVRKSKRQRGERPLAHDEAVAEAEAELGAAEADGAAAEQDAETAGLLTQEQYFEQLGQDILGAVESDGRFHGWVNPAVCERYGIPPDPNAAWEAGGGGAFSHKIDKKAVPSGLKGRGWSDARAFSHTQLTKNPNAYFYRHVAPHEQQSQGEWTEEEHRLFVETARAHGVGDKWGLFASYLPQRVGYQCSAYYRDVIIPQGLVIDRRYRMTRNGRAVYVG